MDRVGDVVGRKRSEQRLAGGGIGQSGAARGHQPKATEAAGLDEDDEIVLDEEPAANSASAEQRSSLRKSRQDKPRRLFRRRLQTLDHRAHSVGDLGGWTRTSRRRWLT